jgi:hypothetical protein
MKTPYPAPGAGVAASPMSAAGELGSAHDRVQRAARAHTIQYVELDSDYENSKEAGVESEGERGGNQRKAKEVDVDLDVNVEEDGNEDSCRECRLDHGTMLCCDGCPGAYHLDCLPKSMQVCCQQTHVQLVRSVVCFLSPDMRFPCAALYGAGKPFSGSRTD